MLNNKFKKGNVVFKAKTHTTVKTPSLYKASSGNNTGCVLYTEIGGNFWPLKTEAKLGVWTGGLGQCAGPLTTLFEIMV